MLELVRSHDLTPDNVARIDAWIHKRRLEHTSRPDPQSPLDAKFSLQYCLARALSDRAVRIEHFEGAAFRDPQVRGIMACVHVAPYTTDQFPAENHFAGEVRVTTKSGKVLTARVDQALGRSVDRPLPEERLKEKFQGCAARVLPDEAIDGVYRAIFDLENLADIRDVTAMLEVAPKRDSSVPKRMKLAQ
jgi:2-methylcitrate dehydratase PrpD